MMRLFIALPLPSRIENELAEIQIRLKAQGGNVKWVQSKNIHLTIRFLGETDEKLVEPISTEMDSIAASFAPVETVLTSLGAFPNLNRPRVIWAGLSGGIDIMSDLAKNMERAVRRLGFEPEKKRFKAHLTLGRVRDRGNLDDLMAFMRSLEVKEVPFRFEQLVLFKSTLTPKGPIYDRLHEVTLGIEHFKG